MIEDLRRKQVQKPPELARPGGFFLFLFRLEIGKAEFSLPL
jgi:hypothetical protein